MELVDRLVNLSGSQIETFFDAHHLGRDYRAAGDKSSKRSRVNSALHAADRRGDLESILDSASQFLLGFAKDTQNKTSELRAPRGIEPMKDRTGGIFLSHAYADRALADLFRNSLILGGITEDQIFYSSDRSTGIPSGEEVRPYLQRSLRSAGLVVELISSTFIVRTVCLMELGGAWALGTPTYPIVVPPLTRTDAIAAIGNVQMGVIESDEEIDQVFDELHDRLIGDLGLLTRMTSWNRAIREFKAQIRSKLAASSDLLSPEPDRLKDAYVFVSDQHAVEIRKLSTRENTLEGEVTNKGDAVKSVIITGTFYGENGNVLGTTRVIVSDLRPNATREFSLRHIPAHARFKIAIAT